MLINQTILMSDAINLKLDEPINPYYGDEVINTPAAIKEHTAIKDILLKNGIKVIQVPSPTGCQDGIYTANWALVRGDTAVMAQLPDIRKDEEPYAEQVLEKLGKKIVHLPKGLKFSGQGDALACGDYLFCGQGYRSDAKAQSLAAKILGYNLIQLEAVPLLDSNGQPAINQASKWPDSYFYDIDLALAIIKVPSGTKKGLIAYCPDAFTPESQKILTQLKDIDKIEVSWNEAKNAFGTNLVSTGEIVVMSAQAPDLISALTNYGLKVFTPEIKELSKGGGYIRCVTLAID